MKTFGLFAGIAAGSLLLAGSAAHADFADVTPAELDNGTDTIGVAWIDFDGDGDLDMFRAFYGGANELWRNDGDEDGDGLPAFVDVAPASPLLQNSGFFNAGGSWADLEGDGDLDVLINCSGSGNKLLRNDGDVVFANISPATLDSTPSGRTAVWVDFDRDGDLDLYLADTGSNSKMFRNDGSSFATLNAAPLSAGAQSATFGDYNGDGYPDLFSVNNGFNQLARNNTGNGTFTAVAGGTIGNNVDALSVGLADFDNDGDLDVFQPKFNSGASNRMYRNDGADVFVDVAGGDLLRTAALAMNASVGDFDNDGDVDIWEGDESGVGGGALLRNDGAFVFTNVTSQLVGLGVAGQYGGGFADYDGDGDLDLFIGTFGGAPQLFRNDLANGNHWLKVELQGTISNASGIGAVVRVEAGGVTQMRQISGGGDGWANQESIPAEFGLGSATTVDEVRVEWPSGQVSVLNGIPADGTIQVMEDGLAPNISAYTPNQAFTFQVPLGGVAIDEMTLFFRVGGQGAAFQSAAMFPSGGGQFYEVGVGQGFASPDGLEGYIEYRMNGGSLQTYPFPGAAGFLPAALPNQAMPQVPAGSQYVMYGLPFVPTNPSPVAVLEDDLGGYDRKRWRSFHFDPLAGSNGTYQEHPGTDPFAPGKGYWLIMAAPVAIGSAGFSTNTVNGMTLDVQRGWNQLAHPYRFPVALASVDFTAAPDVEQEIHAWDGTQYVTDTQLDAWDGFFIFNAAAVAQPIGIPGVTSTAAPSPAPPAESLGGGWRLSFDVRQGGTRDRGNELGTADGATDEPDRLDRHAPPAPPGAVRAYFEQVAGDGVPHELNRDLRGSREGTWDLVVEAPEEVGARIEVDGVSDLPAELEAVLIPLDTWATIDLRGTSFVDVPGGRTHRFRVVVGSNAYVETVRSGQDSAPLELALGLGYPNPLVSSTKIGFALPSESSVRLAVYDVTGRKVRTLVDGTRAAGRYVAEWNAQDESGRAVAPGVYFVKMLAGSREETRKLTVLR